MGASGNGGGNRGDGPEKDARPKGHLRLIDPSHLGNRAETSKGPPETSPLLIPDQETVIAAEALLAAARSGRLRGLVYGAILLGGTTVVNATGQASESPLIGLGAVEVLRNDLLALVRTFGL